MEIETVFERRRPLRALGALAAVAFVISTAVWVFKSDDDRNSRLVSDVESPASALDSYVWSYDSGLFAFASNTVWRIPKSTMNELVLIDASQLRNSHAFSVRNTPVGSSVFLLREVSEFKARGQKAIVTVDEVSFSKRALDDDFSIAVRNSNNRLAHALSLIGVYEKDGSVVFDASAWIRKFFFVFELARGEELESVRFLHSPRAFPENAVLRLGFQVKKTVLSEIQLAFGMSKLPERPALAPRLANDSVGYFTTNFKGVSANPTLKNDVFRMIQRRAKPFTLYLDPSVPDSFKNAVSRGATAWNDALLEATGHKNFVSVSSNLPSDYSPEDLRYDSISFTTSESDVVFAIGPVSIDPRDGRIVQSDIVMTSGWVRAWSETLHRRLKGGDVNGASRICGYSAVFFDDRKVSLTKSQAESGIASVIMHEVGHVLGLRHNFKGSLQSTSVMDYLPMRETEPLFATKIGAYDREAIQFGYGKALKIDKTFELFNFEVGALRKRFAFATDEASAVDPLAQPYDDGADPLNDFYPKKVEYLKRLSSNAEPDVKARLESSIAFYGQRILNFHNAERSSKALEFFIQKFLLDVDLFPLKRFEARLNECLEEMPYCYAFQTRTENDLMDARTAVLTSLIQSLKACEPEVTAALITPDAKIENLQLQLEWAKHCWRLTKGSLTSLEEAVVRIGDSGHQHAEQFAKLQALIKRPYDWAATEVRVAR